MERFCFYLLFCRALILFSITSIFAHGLYTNYTCSSAELIPLRWLLARFPVGNFTDWQTSDDCCSWGHGITCTTASHFLSSPNNSSTSHAQWRPPSVTGLILNTTLTSGSRTYRVPFSLCNLSSLVTLRLNSAMNMTDFRPMGGLSGSIPRCVGTHLTNLVELNLSFNQLTGPLPPNFFSHLHSLRALDLHRNRLTGRLFPSLGLLPNLTTLDLSSNFFSGPLPSFHNPLLQQLGLAGNSFSSFADAGHSSLPSLTDLDLSSNRLSGEIPTFDPSRFPSLSSLDLSSNSLTHGSLPDSICGLRNLTSLVLFFNSLSGSFLLSRSGQCRKLMFAHSLAYLDVSHNKIEGPFPDWIGSLTNLRTLRLSYNSLSGSLPNSWQNLSLLQHLELSPGNSLVGPHRGAPRLPSWFFSLPSLQSLSLSSLGLQATDLYCPSLLLFLNRSTTGKIHLDLSNNSINLDGLVCLSNLSTPSHSHSQFRSLMLSGNPLALNLNLPEAIQLLPPSFSDLDMSSCELRGRLSDAFFDRIGASVSFLFLSHNYLEGALPAQLGNLSNLGLLSLSGNRLEGQVPAQLGNLSNLHTLSLSSNYLEGQVPAELGNLSWLYSLDLSNNNLTGFATFKQKLSRISTIRLSNNHLTGKLSSLLENILDINACTIASGMLSILDVSSNFLTGAIPPWLGPCIMSDAIMLDLHNNHLQGLIPNELFNANNHQLESLSLSGNQLTGQIPSSFRYLNNLMVLDLSHNRLMGRLETSSLFGNASNYSMESLQVLVLGDNEFTGLVPPSLAAIAPALQVIDLSNNHLTGMIPVHTLQSFSAFRILNLDWFNSLQFSDNPYANEFKINVKGTALSYPYFKYDSSEFGYVLNNAMTLLDLSGNNMSGPIPAGLDKLSGLSFLNLSRNKFSGLIPGDIGKLARQLQSLDLSYNELIGPIPASFQNLTALEVFNVSYNPGLSGPIPQNQPQFETAESYIGDPNLCGDPILHACSGGPQFVDPSLSISTNIKSNAFAEWIDEWVSIPGFCIGMVVGLLGTLYALAFLSPR